MPGQPAPYSERHGYSSHPPGSFARFYRRAILAESCGCAERGLDPSNRPGDAGFFLGALLRVPAAIAAAWRRVTGRA